MRPVAQMGREFSPGGACIVNLLWSRTGMPDCDNQSCLRCPLDEIEGFRPFWGKGNDSNAAAGTLLPLLKFVPVRRTNMFPWVRAASPIFRRNVWTFHVDAEHRPIELNVFIGRLPDIGNTF